jgi:sulfite reductase alpha subunit-like flavoprotein
MSTEPARARHAPAASVLVEAGRRNAELGHENLGPLSEKHGFSASEPPPRHLPGEHAAWTQAAEELPELTRTLTIRGRLEEIPLLDASPDALDDRYLLRAASVIGLLNQAYNNVPIRAPERLPEQLSKPWLQIAERLGRPAMTLNTNDYIWFNYRLIDPDAADPMRADNMRVLTDIWGHPQMERFMLVTLEMMAQSAPVVGCTVRAQEAAARRDDDALKAELAKAAETVRDLTFVSLPKINTNSRSGRMRVDPVIWTKLFAMLPLPVMGAEGVRNASGVETPFFHLMDVFLGRKGYATQLGHESTLFRDAFPRHWREFLAAIAAEPVHEYVAASEDRELKGMLQQLAEAYHGDHGLLARHRLKAFAFMDAAFKAGRSSTVTGFSGMFEDRAWEKVDASFEEARVERQLSMPPSVQMARFERAEDVCAGVRRVVLDVRGLGIVCEPGDRCALMPENDPQLVERTLEALRARGEEIVHLTKDWQVAFARRPGRGAVLQASLRDVLAFGHIRPVARSTAKALLRITRDEALHAIVEARTEDQWELWDLMNLLIERGFSLARLRRAEHGDYERLCRILPPMQPRLYSVSGIESGATAADRIELTVGALKYESVRSPTTVVRPREGTASTYVCRTLDTQPGAQIPVEVVRPGAFSLPGDPAVPIVMFAGGTGIAPFRTFLQARAAMPATQNLLFAAARTADVLPYRQELEAHAARGEVELHLALSRDPAHPRRLDDVIREPATAARLRELIGAGAVLYTCGRATFSRTIMDALAEILDDEPGRSGREALYCLIAEQRYMQDVFTTYTGSAAEQDRLVDASELIHHTTPDDGIWMAINGRVYDLTEFGWIHPGGHKIIESFAGMDATSSYRIVEHHLAPEVEAMLSMYEIGLMRRHEFRRRWTVAIGEKGLEHLMLDDLFRHWLRCLYVLVEIESAHRLETGIREEPLNGGEYDGHRERSPYRLQFGVEAHGRFVRQTVPVICGRFGRLWRITSGSFAPDESFQALDVRLDEILQGPAAVAARADCAELERMLAEEGATAALEQRLLAHRAANTAYLRTTKSLLASGVTAFETHGPDVLLAGRADLRDALTALPALTRERFEAVRDCVG